MQREELKEYLRNVSILERQVYVYQNSKMEYTQKINELEQIPYVQTCTEEQKEEWKKTEGYKQLMEARRKRYNKKFWLQRLLKGIVWAAYFAGSLYMGIDAGSDFIIPFVAYLALAIPLIMFINHLFKSANDDFNRQEDIEIDYYFRELAQEEMNARVRETNPPMIARLHEECDTNIIIPQQQAESLLKQMYNKNVIHPKYRSLLVVEQLYEYLDTGRCTELEGPYGAYNLYESELRQNLIIDRLDSVIRNLQTLNRTMFYATNAIMESNQKISQISREMQGIKENTALISYAASSLAEDSRIAMKYHLHLR